MNKTYDLKEENQTLLVQNFENQSTNIFQQYLFFWIFSVFKKGYKKPLTQKDIPKVQKKHSSQENYYKYKEQYDIKQDMQLSILQTQKKYIYWSYIFYWLTCTFQLILPYILSKAQNYFLSSNYTLQNIILFASLQFAYYFGLSLFQPIYQFLQSLLSVRIQGVLQIALLNKSINFSLSRSKKYNSGELLNMLQVDVLQASNIFFNKFQVLLFPYQLIISLCIFYITVKKNSVVPAIGIILQAILGIIFGYFFGKIQNKFMNAKDQRMEGVEEALLQVKQIKLNCFENFFEKRIKNLRNIELTYLQQQVLLLILIQFIQNILSFLAWECTFYFTDFITFSITTVIIQNSSQLMYLLQNFPNQLKNYYTSVNSNQRINEFLKQEEISIQTKFDETNIAININGKFDWKQIDQNLIMDQNILLNLNLNIQQGQFIIIIGNAGSGKSTILKSILNESNCIEGKVHINGTLSIATQEPWIICDNLKNNITYQNKFNEQRYKEIIKICQLEQDIQQFINQDQTILSEKGDNLSGGQQKRINLARTLYNDTDIYLFDDPLSALDIQVQCKIYQECFLKFLQNKTRILFTNSFQNINGADQIYILKDGQLIEANNFMVPQKEIKFQQISKEFENQYYKEEIPNKKSSFLIHAEDQQIGSISNQVIKSIFLFQGGLWAILVIVLYFSILIVLSTISNSKLSNPNLNPEEFRNTALIIFPIYNIPIYIAIISITGYFLLIGIKTSSYIHNNVFATLMKASFTQFYNRIILGRLINRLSKDIYNIDMQFPTQIYNLSIQLTNLITPLITSLIFLNKIAYPIVIIFMIILFIFTFAYYKCLVEMTRIESVSKSPVCSYFQQIIRGILYVRTCLNQKTVQQNFSQYIDVDLGNQMYLFGLQCWFQQSSGIITNIFQSLLFCVCLLYPNENPAMTFLIVIQMSNVSQLLVQVAINSGNLLMSSISFERCLTLINDIEQEDYQYGTSINNFNKQQSIIFNSASFQYPNNQKDVLQQLSLTIQHPQKIGVVGRTGAGKSSIIMALTRMIQNTDGTLEINSKDFNEYKLQDLRSLFSIIPQDTLLFKGTLKDNIDPENQIDIEIIRDIYTRCQLNNTTSFSKQGLKTLIQKNGCNLSQGEKQLVAIARCMAEKKQIVLIDEATANIDSQIEEQIKQIFETFFVDCTMITIAHKITTIMNSDKIIVLSNGRIIENDSPQELLKQPNSEFKLIVDLINNENL